MSNTQSSFLKGAAFLTVTMMLSKILGFIYVIPFTNMVGTQGFILFEYAYKPYAIMLSIATMGIPMAVSKFVSKYNQLGDYETGRRLFRSGILVLSITGLFWAFILYLASPMIAGWLIDENQTSGNSLADVAFVIKTVSFALIVVPVMSLVRGFFQGNQKMNPTGVSQVVEQLIRIVVILLATYLVLNYGSGSIKEAIGWSTFAATIGAVGSMLVLYWYWRVYKPELQEQMTKNNVKLARPSLLSIYKELLYYSIPFVIVSLAIPVYQNIDIFSINPTLIKAGLTQEKAEYVNSIVAIVGKVVTIPIIFANAFALTLVPSITKSYIEKNLVELHDKITKTFKVIFFVTLPFSVFLFFMPQETFGVLLGVENAEYGGEITKSYAFIALFFSFFVVTTSILQGINKQYFAVVSLFLGLLVKMTIAVPMITWFSGAGTSYSTMIGFGISVLINLWVINREADYSFKVLGKQSLAVLIISAMTGGVIVITKWAVLSFDLNIDSMYLNYALLVGITGLVSASFYVAISYKMGLMQMIKKTK